MHSGRTVPQEQGLHFGFAHQVVIGLALGAYLLSRGHEFGQNGICALIQLHAGGEVEEQFDNIQVHGDRHQLIAFFRHFRLVQRNRSGQGIVQAVPVAEGPVIA